MVSLSTKLPLKHPSLTPKKRGLYVRDWRGTDILPASDRVLSVDLWEPIKPPDPMAPGLWFVWPGWNDASRERLPWREATRAEKAEFLRENPLARITVKCA